MKKSKVKIAKLKIVVQVAGNFKNIPSTRAFKGWVEKTLPKIKQDTLLTIRIVGKKESAALNQKYRHKKGPTNVLSFGFENDDLLPYQVLGDLVICAPLVKEEAIQQKKPLTFHWAHLIIHGVLHLLGYEHNTLKKARVMEKKEDQILSALKI
jgi:probable rRNA maturation factor